MNLPSSPALPYASDADLLSQWLEEKDQIALEQLIEKHSGLVMGVCRQKLKSAHDAEDAFQSTFRKLIEHAGSIRNQKSLAGWLFKVAQNEAFRLLSKSKREQPVDYLQETESAMSDEVSAEQKAELQAMFEEVQELPDNYQESVVLCYLEGRTQQQAATELGITPAAVKARLSRGRMLLKKRLLKRGVGLASVLAAWSSSQAMASTAVTSAVVQKALVGCLKCSATNLGTASLTTSTLSKGTTWMAISSSKKMVASAVVLFSVLGGGAVVLLGVAISLLIPSAKENTLPNEITPVAKTVKQEAVDSELSNLIQKIKENEKLYSNIELSMNSESDMFGESTEPILGSAASPDKPTGIYPEDGIQAPANGGVSVNTKKRFSRSTRITQQGKFKYFTSMHQVFSVIRTFEDKRQEQEYLEQKTTRLQVYDGEYFNGTTSEKNVKSRKIRLPDFKLDIGSPQAVMLGGMTRVGGFLLSSILPGEIKSVVGRKSAVVKSKLLEREEIEDRLGKMEIQKVSLQLTYESQDEPVQAEIILSLAVNRNYIPAKAEYWGFTEAGEKRKAVVWFVKEWQEVEPKVWYPKKIEQVSLNPTKYFGKFNSSIRDVFTFEVLSLKTNYPDEFFRLEETVSEKSTDKE